MRLRKPFCVNDVPSQTALLDRREVYHILEKHKIPTPRHLYVDRTTQQQAAQGRRSPQPEVEEQIAAEEGAGVASEPVVEEFPDYILINGQRMRKPLVEKPMDADDHSVIMSALALQPLQPHHSFNRRRVSHLLTCPPPPLCVLQLLRRVARWWQSSVVP